MTDSDRTNYTLPSGLLDRIQFAAAAVGVSVNDWIIAACEEKLIALSPSSPQPLETVKSPPDYDSIRDILDRKFPKNRVSQVELDRWLMIYLAIQDYQG